MDIWIEDLSHDTASRFTFDPSEEATAIWSRDGRTIAYRYNGADGAGIVTIKKASGLEAAGALYPTRPQDDILPNSWTLDDKSILNLLSSNKLLLRLITSVTCRRASNRH